MKIQKIGPSVMMATPQVSSNIDYKELQIGKLVGSGEFAGLKEFFFFCY